MPESITVPTYALTELISAAIVEGVGDRVGAAIAHLAMIARQQGVEVKIDIRNV